MKLNIFVGGAFGTVGFGLSLLAGLSVSNSVESILTKGLLCAGSCWVVGFFVGMIAQQISVEHSQRIAQSVAENDARTAQTEAEEAVAREAESAAILAAASSPQSAAGV